MPGSDNAADGLVIECDIRQLYYGAFLAV